MSGLILRLWLTSDSVRWHEQGMSPTPITKRQFFSWLVVFTIGLAVWALPSDSGWFRGGSILACSNLILMSPSERSRHLRAREVLRIIALMIVYLVLMIVVGRSIPEHFGASLARLLQHPVSIAVIWLATVWIIYRRHRGGPVRESSST